MAPGPVRPMPPHGTPSRYSNHGCRCTKCRTGKGQYEARRVRQTAYGTWEPFVDAAPVRAHVLSLMEQGLGWRRIAELAGINRSVLGRLLYGKPSAGQEPSRRVRRRTAERLLAVRFDSALLADATHVDATGTWRRIHALVAVGWPQAHLARALGFERAAIQLRKDRVLVSNARKVAELYERLWDADPTSHGVSPGQASRARKYAADRGWPPPMAWDDNALDVPQARSACEGTQPVGRVPRVTRAEEIVHLASFGLATSEIARRVGVTVAYARQVQEAAARSRPGRRTA